MTLTQGAFVFFGAIACGWFLSWASRKVPKAQCPKCYSYKAEIIKHEDIYKGCETGKCNACNYEWLESVREKA